MFKPVNRHLLVEMPLESDTESLVILPDNYQPRDHNHAVVSVLDIADDAKHSKKYANSGRQVNDRRNLHWPHYLQCHIRKLYFGYFRK